MGAGHFFVRAEESAPQLRYSGPLADRSVIRRDLSVGSGSQLCGQPLDLGYRLTGAPDRVGRSAYPVLSCPLRAADSVRDVRQGGVY